MDEANTNPALISKLRRLVHHYREKHRYKTALFWADKAASLSKYEVQDMYNLTQCMYSAGEYERAALFIKCRALHEKYAAFRYLAAKCYSEAKEWQQALDLLEDSSFEIIPRKLFTDTEDAPGIPTNKEMQASILLLKGDIYEAKDTRQYAAQCYEEALLTDVFCYEAFDRLIAHQMLFPSGEQELIETLPIAEQCQSDKEKELITFLYETKIKKYSKPFLFEIPPTLDNLHENLEVATSLAERHYYSCEFKSSYQVTSGILRSDPFHSQCLPLHIALLFVLKKSNELFYLSHKLVKTYPENAVSWYAVGCYYLLQPKKQELTRRYLLKATLIDKMYGPAWLALGHSFSLEGEHDQAMAAYFTATQLMRGSHLPYLYSGIEYSVTNNLALTDMFFNVALKICPDDPHTLHEIGVASYTLNNFSTALKYFNKALELLKQNQEDITSEEWEALLSNMGHVHRKLKNYNLALKFHKQALVLAPQSAQTYTNIGFVLSYMGRYGEALEYLHKALGLRRDDVFAVRLIESVIEFYGESEPAVSGDGGFSEDDMGAPPPFSHRFGDPNDGGENAQGMGDMKNLEPLEESMESSSHVSPSGAIENTETETPVQISEKDNLSKKMIPEENANDFQTPEDFMLGRPLPPALRGLKKTQSKSRRVISSPAPVPLNFTGASEDTPSPADGAVITPVLASRKMLTMVSSESSDDGGLVGMAPVPDADRGGEEAGPSRERTQSTEDAWSTSVLKGGGRGFEQVGGTEITGVSDSVIMMLGDSVAGVSDSSMQSTSESQTSASGIRTPIETRSVAANKRARDENESSDMEMDETLD